MKMLARAFGCFAVKIKRNSGAQVPDIQCPGSDTCGCAKTLSGSVALDNNPAAERRRKFDRHARHWSYGTHGRKPGQMVQIDRKGVAIEAGFCVKESVAVCPVSKLCCMRACSRATAAGRYEFHQF